MQQYRRFNTILTSFRNLSQPPHRQPCLQHSTIWKRYSGSFNGRKRVISTLDPEKLQPSDFVDISGLQSARVTLRYPGSLDDDEPEAVLLRYYVRGGGGRVATVPWPEGTRGFLYFYRPSSQHPAAGSIRFRLVDTPSRKAFSSGKDLLLPSGHLPWANELLALRRRYPPIYKMLQADNFITRQQETAIDAILPSSLPLNKRTRVLHNISDPFVVDFSHSAISLVLLHGGGITEIKWRRGLSSIMSGTNQEVCSPYTGVGIVRFELARDPNLSRSTATKLVIRVLKFLEPPVPGSPFQQKEGELLRRRSNARPEVFFARSTRKLPEKAIDVLEKLYSHQIVSS